jgi:hypothetical protein
MNIEDAFFKFKQKSFPHEHDYVTTYKTLKPKLDKQIHPEVKVKMKEYHPNDYYNDHGVDHIKMVIDRASRIIECLNPTYSKRNQKDKFYISPYEIFILLMSIQIHDAGHVLGTRKEHPTKAKELLSKLDLGEELTAPEKKIIGDIAKSHSGTDNPIGKIQSSFDLTHENIRPQFLASILRLADELAEDSTRASRFLLENDEIEEMSLIYHYYSLCINSVKISGKEISMKFYLNEETSTKLFKKETKDGIIETYLIDEIYERTLKTFTETLYCTRFLPENCRFNSIKVTIFIDDKYHEQIIAPIAYELKENGYPLLGQNNKIFDICKDLSENGVEKNGKYFAELINSKK